MIMVMTKGREEEGGGGSRRKMEVGSVNGDEVFGVLVEIMSIMMMKWR